MSEYRTKRPGDVLRLPHDISSCDAGGYVILSMGDTVCLSLVGENPDGMLCATTELVEVPIADLCRFQVTGLAIDPIG